MIRRLTSPLLVISLALCLGADKEKNLHYLAKDSVNVFQLLPDPPKAGSDEDRQELALVLDVSRTRSEEDVTHAKSEEKLTVFEFADIVGPWFTPERCPATAVLFSETEGDLKYFSALAKHLWERPRPPFANAQIKPAVTLDNDGSYPSGHATRGMLFAEILADLIPEKKAAILARGQRIGWDRVVAGVHYPSDVVAGRILGHNLAFALANNAEFHLQLEKVRRELVAAQKSAESVTAAVSH